uniref:Cellulose synthase n=1 Tax=Quercus lobata TaxID=97700 RepID=A0A7N2LQX4_QUELO
MATELAKDRTQQTIMESKDSENLYLGTITESHEGMVIAREARQWLGNWDEVGDGKGQEKLQFCFYWFVTTVVQWNPIYLNTFKDHLSHRYQKAFPGIDIFVCIEDPMIEPPVMVINIVLSVMAYAYPLEKLSVYISHDGGSVLTFNAMLQEASCFSKIWLPFCKKFRVEPRLREANCHTVAKPLRKPIRGTSLGYPPCYCY